MRSHAGFTLIEALVVLGMVGVLAAVALPAVGGALARYNLTSAGQQVASTVRAVRFQAVGRNQRVRMVITQASGQYHREAFDPVAGVWTRIDAAGNADANAIATSSLPEGITFDAAVPANVEFTAEGRPTAAANIGISNGDESLDRTITVSMAGRVQIE